MKQGLFSNEWLSAEVQSAEINPKAYREETFLIVSLKILFKKLNNLFSIFISNKSDKTQPHTTSKTKKIQTRRSALGRPAIKLLCGGVGGLN